MGSAASKKSSTSGEGSPPAPNSDQQAVTNNGRPGSALDPTVGPAVTDSNRAPNSQDFIKVKRQEKVTDEDNRSVIVPYTTEDNPLINEDEICHVCQVFTGSQVYGCRICDRVFHENCLKKIGQCSDNAEITLLERAGTSIGWSCYFCGNLNSLLTQEEISELERIFRKLDINKDSAISIEEFVRFRKKQFQEEMGRAMSSTEEKLERERFLRIDANNSGTIDWHEFLNHESIKILARRTKNALVKLLTKKEINNAKDIFKTFDQNGDGNISETEAKAVFQEWYRRVMSRYHKGDMSSTDPILDVHIQEHTKLIMEADHNKDGFISWHEFIKEQALYILAARPNRLYIPVFNDLNRAEDEEGN